MINILIPTDFTATSVKMVDQAIKSTTENAVNCILFHAFSLPDSPHDLLGSGYREPALGLMNEAFRQACKQLKDDNPKKVNKIFIRCMNGDTKAVFRNFVDANDIDLIYFPDNFTYSRIHEQSVNPTTFFKKSGLPIINETCIKRELVINNKYLSGAAVVTN